MNQTNDEQPSISPLEAPISEKDTAPSHEESTAAAEETSTLTEKSKAPEKPPGIIRPSLIPKDFALRIATRIITINEREMNDQVANGRVADLLYRNLKEPEIHDFLMDSIDILLHNPETQKYAARIWVSLAWSDEDRPEYIAYMHSITESCAIGHRQNSRETWEDFDSGKSFSFYAYMIGECFIQMMKLNSDLYDIITDMFGYLIRSEMTRDLEEKDKKESNRKGPSKKGGEHEEGPTLNPKKLYDDVVDYVSNRGDFRSDTLNQKNPNEFILVLADRMRSTRRYVIQDIMNRFALEKKKQLEKELKEREASAEEVIQSSRPYNHGLYLYWVEKRYNFKYLAVEKVRITLQVFGFLLAIGAVGASYLDLWSLSIIESLITAALMVIFSKIFCSRYIFLPFYPKDVTAELEEDVGLFTPVFRKMSAPQMNSFISKQIKQPENNMLLHLLPEYMKYVFAVMPDRSNILMNKEEVNEMLERLEASISKFQRGSV